MKTPLYIGLRGLAFACCVTIGTWYFTDLVTGLWVFLAASLFALAIIDAKTCWLPDVITLPLLVLGLLIQTWPETRTVGIEHSIMGALIGSLPLWLMATIYRWRTGKNGLGLGDVKLITAMGSWAGPVVIPHTMVISAMAGLIWGLCANKKKPWARRRIAFGPFLVIGYAVSVFVSRYSGWLPWI